jgi:hypothetical protein
MYSLLSLCLDLDELDDEEIDDPDDDIDNTSELIFFLLKSISLLLRELNFDEFNFAGG